MELIPNEETFEENKRKVSFFKQKVKRERFLYTLVEIDSKPILKKMFLCSLLIHGVNILIKE